MVFVEDLTLRKGCRCLLALLSRLMLIAFLALKPNDADHKLISYLGLQQLIEVDPNAHNYIEATLQ
jgi:hypothetical protein